MPAFDEGSPLYIPYLVKRAQHLARAAADDALRPIGLSASQFGVLRRLAETPDISGAELARQLSVTAQSMNEMLALLVAAGYIERKPHPTHGRIVRMRLTAAGKRALAKATDVVERVTATMLSGLTAYEQRAFARYLQRCIASLESSPFAELPA